MSIKLGVGGSLKNVSAAYLGVKNCWLNFDGSSLIFTNDSTVFEISFPIEVTFKASSTPASREYIFYKRGGGKPNWVGLYIDPSDNLILSGNRFDNDAVFNYILYTIANYNNIYSLKLDLSGTDLLVYINKTLQNTITGTSIPTGVEDTTMSIGNSYNGGSNFFTGNLYKFSIGSERLLFNSCSGFNTNLGKSLTSSGATWDSETILKQVNNIYLGNGGVLKTIL